MGLTTDQTHALERFREWLDSGAHEFALVGYAGTGKSWLTRILVEQELAGRNVIAAAPSHKARQILSGFLGGNVPVATVASLSGERMMVREDEQEEFIRMGKGKLTDGHGFVLVDEISMVRADQYQWISDTARMLGARVIVIGDPAQLRPVNGKSVRLGSKVFPWNAVLRQIVRSGDTLSRVGQSVRDGTPWDPAAVRVVADLSGDFLEQVEVVDGEVERVLLAHTNAEVRLVQEAACVALYGHGRSEARAGEWIRAENTCEMVNADLGQVEKVTPSVDSWGETVLNAMVGGRGMVLAPFERKDRVLGVALDAKKKWGSRDGRTRRAWAHYYEVIKRYQLFSHPYAMTIHKSQGSTFSEVWTDLHAAVQFDSSLAYVAATRASSALTIKESAR